MMSILFIGNGNELADQKSRDFCVKNKIHYQGLLDSELSEYNGGYHTSIYDLSVEKIKKIATYFEKIILLDQKNYLNKEDFLKTIELVHDLEKITTIIYVDKSFKNEILTLLDSSSTFCLAPFVGIHIKNRQGKNKITPCCFYKNEFSEYTELFEYNKDTAFVNLRNNLLNGKFDPGCKICYDLEYASTMSPRKQFSKEWALKLGITNLANLSANPVYYDVRLGNQCNMMCRTCNPKSSNLIDKEYVALQLTNESIGTTRVDNFSKIDSSNLECLYISGGEPSINEDFANFLESCIEKENTNFELTINTNALVITDYFLSLTQQFRKVKFEISIDGYDKVNTYIRWPGDWTKIHNNINKLKEVSNNRISFNSVISIYNISNLYSLFKYINSNYPNIESHISYTISPEQLSPWKFPNKDLALKELEKVKLLNLYNNEIFKNKIQGLEKLISEYQIKKDEIVKFFKWNDILDNSRKIKLVDYIPELEKCRHIYE